MSSTQRLSMLVARSTRQASSTPYVCRSCRSKIVAPSRSNASQLRHASNRNLPWTEQIRRKLWGTDNPPGPADPYGGPSFLERRKMQRQRREVDTAEEQAAMEELEREEQERDTQRERGEMEPRPARRVPQEYKPARTWDGLMHVGHLGNWQDVEPVPEDEYSPWYGDAGLIDEELPRTKQDTLDVLLVAAADANVDYVGEEILEKRLDFGHPSTFKILKNFSRLTSNHFPLDSRLNALSRDPNSTYAQVVDLWLEMINKPPPKNLYEELAVREDLTSQSNVMVLSRRETPVDKEKEVGRWKVIEKELQERGLPVLGRADTVG